MGNKASSTCSRPTGIGNKRSVCEKIVGGVTMSKGEIANIETWTEDHLGIIIVITYEDGGYDEKTIYWEEIDHEFDYVPEGC
jgi:hypothetical protein